MEYYYNNYESYPQNEAQIEPEEEEEWDRESYLDPMWEIQQKKDNPIKNLNYAFDVAEKYLDIPKMLDAEGKSDSIPMSTVVRTSYFHEYNYKHMVNTVRPDERSVMTYVAAYYHAFANSTDTESAASRIAKVLKANQDTEKLMAEYAKIASDLLQWIQKQTPFLADRTTDGTLPGAKEKLARYNSYRGIEKPPKLEDKVVLEALNKTLQTRLKLDKKPAFLPPKGQSVSEIQDAWKEMEFREKGFEVGYASSISALELGQLLCCVYSPYGSFGIKN
ncbi:unnamed protein product [Schistocephalus solidus]|uniref:Angiotensin-converting enzyme n=1 Tax=Schistocephalus solidus TaxID=70667 RepID=A0A183S8B5_SCHSO|nr:unnamed protein product [Schistocephalus solidus]